MQAWRRAIGFMRRIDERTAQQVIPFRWGRALIDQRFHLVHDANYLVANQLDGADAAGVIAEAERIQGAALLQHRRINVDDESVADRLRADFVARGFTPERFVLMAHRRPSGAAIDPLDVREVEWRLVRPARERRRWGESWATPDLVRQIMVREELIAKRIATRYFAVLDDGHVVSSCELRTEDRTAQVDTVETLEEYRNRGFAWAVVSAALAAARGCAFVFLVADADDWPQHLYRRLGFADIGYETRYLRRLDL